MKAYGVKKGDAGCCPGHDKYPSDRYLCTSTEARRKRQKSRKTSARQNARMEIRNSL